MAVTETPLERYFTQRAVEMYALAPGIQVPWRFSDTRAEHLATRRAAGLFDFSFVACAEVKGDESLELFHRIQTRNLATLAVGGIRYTLLLRDDGTVLNDATVWRTGERAFLLFVGRREDLELVTRPTGLDAHAAERSGHLALLALQGPSSRAILGHCLDIPDRLGYFRFAESRFAGCTCLVARLGYSGEMGYEVVLASDLGPTLWKALQKAGGRHGLQECGFAAADTLRIEAGHILFTNELAQAVTPEELRLERLVDIRRTSRRTHWRPGATPARCLVGLTFERNAPQILPALDEGVVVTSACRSPTLGRSIGLAYVPWESRYAGTSVSVRDARARVARLPFYDPGRRLPRALV